MKFQVAAAVAFPVHGPGDPIGAIDPPTELFHDPASEYPGWPLSITAESRAGAEWSPKLRALRL